MANNTITNEKFDMVIEFGKGFGHYWHSFCLSMGLATAILFLGLRYFRKTKEALPILFDTKRS